MTTILDGPRGRRLCLELASARDEGVLRLVAELGFALDPDHARGRAPLLRGDPEGPLTESALTAPEIHARVAVLVKLLRRGNLAGLRGEEITAALVAATDSARYWLSPDGEDVLAAIPAVRKALQRWARAVEASPVTGWWSSGCRLEQWALDDQRDSLCELAPDQVAESLAARAQKVRDDELRAQQGLPADVRAAVSGTWWSIPEGSLCTTGSFPDGVPVFLRTQEDSLHGEWATAVAVAGGGRFFEIASAADWVDLCRRFPMEVTASRRHDWYRVTGRDGRWVVPDWQRVAEHWDTVHLTARAYLAAATREIVVDDDVSSMIAGWAPDAAYWIGGTARVQPDSKVVWQLRAGQWWRAVDSPDATQPLSEGRV